MSQDDDKIKDSENENENDMFVFDDINNDLDINEFSTFEPLNRNIECDDHITLTLNDGFMNKLNDTVLAKNIVTKLDEPDFDTDEEDANLNAEDPLEDHYYELHHRKLRKLELQDYIADANEIKDYLLELEEHLDILDRDLNINENTQLNKRSTISNVFNILANTVNSICKVHNPQDTKELLEKKDKCVKHIKSMIQNYKYNQFKRSFLIKGKFHNNLKNMRYVNPLNSYRSMMIDANQNDDLDNKKLTKYSKPSIYNSFDYKYLYLNIDEIEDNIDKDSNTDIEEDCMLSNMATADDIKTKRLKEIYHDTGITYGKLKLNSIGKDLFIEPFRKPYIR
ncbi:hypothetical protein HANVADRAFT_54886 [Hanseniaspora valbyensis NRRL Y-1626]|uniref:Something about silencing protein 4 domain-containing protein n=1 Tax=Hanseniaspora valbyensis NRRL Y-1626 TaxID=766949 RepID=A0A1B7TIC9_9ASCO|nr:hypothetical protein HANVADRAFT_54886 [Hanseniaspora valbyensis NRRL Y-1626]